MALTHNTTHKGLKAPKAYAMIQSLYTKKTGEDYETSVYLKVFDTEDKENELYCDEEKISGEKDVENSYLEIKKLPKWEKWKDC